ncbi:hypothetical protein LSH36_332g00003 [Paralvinella palmiformis]|uniref:Uncharacterized protein n=1 Tax=Paralvinella palmiformis TaxID=53620 RepID=A0AAD9JFZ5_9ANNE|nr:hypothetical protein LSH36_332g00003 [Paralvinella palmiformis]
MSENVEKTECHALSKPRIASLLGLAFAEAFLFGYIMDGWPSIEYMLKSDGVYSNICPERPADNQSVIRTNWRKLPIVLRKFSSTVQSPNVAICPEQNTMFITAYLVANILAYDAGVARSVCIYFYIVSQVTMVYGYLNFLILILAPSVGYIIDHQVTKAVKGDISFFFSFDVLTCRNLLKCLICLVIRVICLLFGPDIETKKAYPVVFSITMATLSAVALSISSLFWTYSAVYVSSVFAIILKGTMYASHLTFIQIVYPLEHQGKAFGVVLTVASCLNLLEEPLFIWAETSNPPFRGNKRRV